VDVCLAVIKIFAMFVDVYTIVQFLIVLMDLMEIVIAVEIAMFFKLVIVMDVIVMDVIAMDVMQIVIIVVIYADVFVIVLEICYADF